MKPTTQTYELTVARDGTIWTGERFTANSLGEAESIGMTMLCKDWSFDRSEYPTFDEFTGDMDGVSLIIIDPLHAAASELLQVAKNALADLQGIMPEHDPSGERNHSAWQTIDELIAAITRAEGQGGNQS